MKAGAILLGLVAALITGIAGARFLIISQMEFHALDVLIRNRGLHREARSRHLPLVVLCLEKKEMGSFQCPPDKCSYVPRSFLAGVVRDLGRLRPAVIAFDVYLVAEGRMECEKQNRDLVRAFQELPARTHVIFVGQVDNEARTLRRPSEDVLPSKVSVVWPVVARPFNRCRMIPLIREDPDQGPVPAFCLSVFLHWKGLEKKPINALSPTFCQIGSIKIPTLESGEIIRLSPFPGLEGTDQVSLQGTGVGPGDHMILINWLGAASAISHRSLSDLRKLPDGALQGQIVVIGIPDKDILLSTPIGRLHGFEVQTNAIATLIANRPLRPMAPWMGFLWTWICSSLIFATRRRGAVQSFGILVGLGIANFLAALVLIRYDIWLYIVLPGLGAIIAYTFAVASEQKALSGFMPGLLRMRESQAFAEATVFVADIRRYSDIAERVEPVTLLKYINQYYNAVEEALVAYGGTLVQSEGDKVIAFFAGNHRQYNHAQSAVLASIDLLKRLKTISERRPPTAEALFRIGIGISTGPCIVAILGRQHRDATLLGNPVNIASHLESLTKQHGFPLILEEKTCTRLEDIITVEPLGVTATKWSNRPIAYYRVAELEDPWARKGSDIAEREAI